MRRVLFVILMWASFALAAFGQSTTVNATITDANGQAFFSGTYRIEFNPNGRNQPFVWSGVPFTPGDHVFTGRLDGSGAFSGVVVPSSNFISPSGTNWKFTVCPASSSPCYTTSIAVQGTTQDVTTQITPPAIIINDADYNQPTAYTDAENIGPKVGFIYFNLTSQHFRACTSALPCTWLPLCFPGDGSCGGGGGGGTVTDVTGVTPITVIDNTTTPIVSCPACVTNVTATSPISSTGGTTPNIALSLTPTTCTNQFISAINNVGVGTCTPLPFPTPVLNRCDIAVGDTSASTAITDAQLGPQKRMCFIPSASTIVEMDVAADNGTPNIIMAVNHSGSDSNIVSSALATAASGGPACSKSTAVACIGGVLTASATLQNTSVAAGDYLEMVSGTAGGVAKLMTIHVIYTTP